MFAYLFALFKHERTNKKPRRLPYEVFMLFLVTVLVYKVLFYLL